jgi:hypothetical protein
VNRSAPSPTRTRAKTPAFIRGSFPLPSPHNRHIIVAGLALFYGVALLAWRHVYVADGGLVAPRKVVALSPAFARGGGMRFAPVNGREWRGRAALEICRVLRRAGESD